MLTDNEIIKALELFKSGENENFAFVSGNALDLINRLKTKNKEFDEKIVIQKGLIDRQKAEIEELNECYTNLSNSMVQHCLDNEKDRQLLGEYQNIFLGLGYALEVCDPNLTEIKGWVTRMLWHCKRCDELLDKNNHLELRLKNANEHEVHLSKALKNAKAEAVKKFAERLKEKPWMYYVVDIDNLVKEMAGETDV